MKHCLFLLGFFSVIQLGAQVLSPEAFINQVKSFLH